MIKIKDYIFNENEIVYINEFDAETLGIMLKGKDKAIFVDAHIEDIQWEYDRFRVEADKDGVIFANKILEKKIKELEEENKKLNEIIDKINGGE